MPVLTPTKQLGATTKTNPALVAEAARTVTDEAFASIKESTGLNGPFLADYLSGMLTHERCGRHLYRSVEGRTKNPILQTKYHEFGNETERHVEILEQLIAKAGGNPNYVSPTARAIQLADTKTLEASFLGSGALDLMTAEMAMLDAVFLAESADHANWQTLGKLVEHVSAGPIQDAFRAACDEVESQEDEHIEWATNMKSKLIVMQARSTMMQKVGEKTEEVVARIKGWFSE